MRTDVGVAFFLFFSSRSHELVQIGDMLINQSICYLNEENSDRCFIERCQHELQKHGFLQRARRLRVSERSRTSHREKSRSAVRGSSNTKRKYLVLIRKRLERAFEYSIMVTMN